MAASMTALLVAAAMLAAADPAAASGRASPRARLPTSASLPEARPIPPAAPEAPPPSTFVVPDALAAALGKVREERGWIDISHGWLERRMNLLVLRLDRFFGEPTHQEDYERPTSLIRLRNEVRTGQDDVVQARTSLGANLRLPAADRLLERFSLVVTGESEPTPPTTETDVDRVPPRFGAPRVRAADGGLELRYDVFRAKRTLVDAGAGARVGMPPPPFTRLRLVQEFPLGVSVVGHLSQSLFWDRREGFGETTRLDVDRAFGTKTVARWWSNGTVDEISRGYEWISEIGVARVLGARTGVYAAAAVAGATRSIADVDQYRVYTRLRRDVHRGWAFVEVEPEVIWPADEFTGRRTRALGLILRLELLFSSAGSPTPLPQVPRPEPST